MLFGIKNRRFCVTSRSSGWARPSCSLYLYVCCSFSYSSFQNNATMGSLAAWSWLIITVCSCHTSSQSKSVCYQQLLLTVSSWGGGTHIHKPYGDVPPFRVRFFDRPLINRVTNSKIFEDFL